jgi:hypothetical protein
MEETNKLIPLRIGKADAHDVSAAKQAEWLADAEHVRAQVDSGNRPVIFSGKPKVNRYRSHRGEKWRPTHFSNRKWALSNLG